jgi:hypothetical protein
MNWNGEMHRVTSPIWCLATVVMAAVGAFAVAGGALAAPAARAATPSPSPSVIAVATAATPATSVTPKAPATGTATTTETPIPNVPTPPPGPLQPTDRLIEAYDMSGADEVPPVATTAGGSLGATLTGSTLCYTFSAGGAGLTMAHLYHGAAGTNGDPVVQLFMNVSGVNEIVTSGCISAANIGGSLAGNWSAFMQALDSGDLYVQLRSLAHPDGEIRGRLFHSPGPGRVPTLTPGAAATPGAPAAPDLGSGRADARGISDVWLVAGEMLLIAAVGVLGAWAVRRRTAL